MTKVNGTKSPAVVTTSWPKATVERLSLYLREVENLVRQDRPTVSSNQLGQLLSLSDAQVRKDLAYFGQFGCPGIGYRVPELRDALRQVLGTNRVWRVGLIGIGNLGRALMGYGGFGDRGFEINALFDASPSLVGTVVDDLTIRPIAQLPQAVSDLSLNMGILTVPASAAQQVADLAVQAGLTGLLNFAPVPLRVPGHVSVVSVDVGLQLEQLAFQLTQTTLNATTE